ncbi:MAG: hypothetical protein LBM67_08455 [Lentimicrobiaceae bacterium]|jgi:hypothetical protein|nr:hypothetical protein [Lentimicrobiaceae bacterium]
MTRDDLKYKIKTIIDDQTPINSNINVGGFDKSPIDDYIENLLDSSADDIQLNAPLSKLTATELTAEFNKLTENIGEVLCPSDYLRLISFKMSDWQKPAIIAIKEESIIGDRQNNKYICGKTAKPVVVIKNSVSEQNFGNLVFEYHSSTKHTGKVLYCKKKRAEELNDFLTEPLCWLVAGNVLSIVGNENFKVTLENAAALLNK